MEVYEIAEPKEFGAHRVEPMKFLVLGVENRKYGEDKAAISRSKI